MEHSFTKEQVKDYLIRFADSIMKYERESDVSIGNDPDYSEAIEFVNIFIQDKNELQ